ncbi:MAG: Ppx/GppA family phosphatase [Gammaproteobacteria bacterium]|nr:Ppx/GppA family phosphatase [Gammaproteobacteria bacterium]
MRVAIIDLGTNSVRFDVHQILGRDRVTRLYREKVIIRLGHDVFRRGDLDQNTIRRTLNAFVRFKKIIVDCHAQKIIAVGTSALREAQDGTELIREIKKQSGIEIRIISGREEAKLIALGILANEPISKQKVGLIDIGGGSTEISISENGKVSHSESFPLGSARLQQIFLKKNPPTLEAIAELQGYVRKTIGHILKRWPRVTQLIGSSGTVKTLVKLFRVPKKKSVLSTNALKKLIRKMQDMTTEELSSVRGMELSSADMILAGALLLRECMRALGVRRVVSTEISLRDGILQELLEISKKKSPLPFAFRLPDLYEKAIRFGENESHIQVMVSMTNQLFRRLQPLHGLDKTWKIYLEAAAILRNAGEMISFLNHSEHSYYLIKQAGFPFVEEWETELIALLCRHHECLKRSSLNILPFHNDRSKRKVFLKLLALLLIVDALDADLVSPIALEKIRIDKSFVRLSFSGGSSLEILRVAERSKLFEKVFKRRLVVKRV